MLYEIKNSESLHSILNQCQEGDTLVLDDGFYEGKFEIWQNHLYIKAKHTRKAIIHNKDYYHKIMPNHNECNTFNTFTVYVGGNHTTLEGLCIQNDSTPSEIFGQAVALHVDGNYFECRDCTIKSAQDTLFTGPMPKDLLKRYHGFYPAQRLQGNPSFQKYIHCDIIGDVDFIFGCATALFHQCKLISLHQEHQRYGYICAPAHDKETPYGYLFYECDLDGTSPTYLARPWRDYGTAAFINCKMSNHIILEGFNKWNGTNRDKTARFYEYSPKINTSSRVSWSHQLTEDESKKYVLNFFNYLSF